MAGARSSRFVPSVIAALAVGLVSGCSATVPITTDMQYAPSDGVRLDLGTSLTVQNLLVISAAEGDAGSLIGGLTNRSEADLVVTLAADGAEELTVQVPARRTLLLGSDDEEPLALDVVSAPPGAVLPMTISTPEGGSEQVSVPVLDGTLPEYTALLPTAAASS